MVLTQKSVTLLLNNVNAMLLPLLPAHPIALKRRQTRNNTATNPPGIDPLLGDNHRHRLDLGIGWRQLTDLPQHLLHHIPKQHIPPGEQNIRVQFLLDIDITGVDVIGDHRAQPAVGVALDGLWLGAEQGVLDLGSLDLDCALVGQLVGHGGDVLDTVLGLAG